MKVLAIKAQLAPRRSERFGRRDRQAAVKRLVEEGKICSQTWLNNPQLMLWLPCASPLSMQHDLGRFDQRNP
jgi:hypothetical protein